MKLYAKTTSERASKGQGGNKFLIIVVRNEQQQCVVHATFYPDNKCNISIIKDMNANIERVQWIGTDDDTKGKKQETAKPCKCGASELPTLHDKKDCKNPY